MQADQATATTFQMPALNTSLTLTLDQAVEKLVGELQAGGRNAWNVTLSDNERFACFKRLAIDRGMRYAAATLDNYETPTPNQRSVVARLRELQAAKLDWCRDGGGLILFGPEGTGKDHLLFAMMRHAIVECGYEVAWRDGQRLQDEIRKSIRDEKEPELRKELSRPHIFAISDPLPPKSEEGKSLTDWNLNWLRDVIDRRYSNLKSTWITFNGSSPSDLKAVLTPQLTARLIDDSFCIHCNWASYRQANIPLGGQGGAK